MDGGPYTGWQARGERVRSYVSDRRIGQDASVNCAVSRKGGSYSTLCRIPLSEWSVGPAALALTEPRKPFGPVVSLDAFSHLFVPLSPWVPTGLFLTLLTSPV